MEKKQEDKKMDSKTSWTQEAKSGQMKATATSTATSTTPAFGSSFSWAAAGGTWTSSGAVSGGAWTSSGSASGGAWTSSETNQWSSHSVLPVLPSRTPYRSVPRRSGPETWKSSKTNESSSRNKSKPPPYLHKEPSPTPEVRQTLAFPSVWSPSTTRKVTKKN